MPAHVERRIVDRVELVVIAERRLESDACVEQGLVRHIELLQTVGRPLRAIEVVAHHRDQLEWELAMDGRHLLREIELSAVARSAVPEHGELEGVRTIGNRERDAGGMPRGDRDQDHRGEQLGHVGPRRRRV
jgi:hypothetical protein